MLVATTAGVSEGGAAYSVLSDAEEALRGPLLGFTTRGMESSGNCGAGTGMADTYPRCIPPRSSAITLS